MPGLKLVPVLLFAAFGCARVFDYPGSESEFGSELCADGRDNDYDGKADCNDPGCDGLCPEEAAEQCGDDRDNDGDGLSDASDPGCWLLRSPQAARCSSARGVLVTETFDSVPMGTFAAPWWIEGKWAEDECVACPYARNTRAGVPVEPEDRQDWAVLFVYNKTRAIVLGENLGVLARREAFAGSFQDFELSFSASVPPQALLRAAIVPSELSPGFDPPAPRPDSESLSLTIDATTDPPLLTLGVDGVPFAKELPFTQALCDQTLCNEYTFRVSVVLDADSFLARVSYPDGSKSELIAPGPVSRSLPASKLVFWGGSTTPASWATLDDVHLRVSPELPCGFEVPQIPARDCASTDALSSFGHSVSIARGTTDEYCALVTASTDPAAGPEVVTAWTSFDGATFGAVSSGSDPPFEIPRGATLVGAAIDATPNGFRAALAYRENETVQVAFSDGETCEKWGALRPGPSLFGDAEAPSYLARGDSGEVYFTRPGATGAPRSLWRVSDGAPEFVTDLPADVRAPVSVTRVGTQDLVLAYPRDEAGLAGIGLLVRASSSGEWSSVAQNPVLLVGPRTSEADGALAFDDRGVAAATLLFGSAGGFLLYAGRSITLDYRTVALSDTSPLLTVGSAWFAPAGDGFPDASVTPAPSCGDQSCSASESCASCPEDCDCRGPVLLKDVFRSAKSWELVSAATKAERNQYLGDDPPSVNVTGNLASWSVLPLERRLDADFELSFDVLLAGTVRFDIPCTTYVGLGTAPELLAAPGATPAAGSGVFARFGLSAYCGSAAYTATPFALGEQRSFLEPEEPAASPNTCAEYLVPGTWRHVVLRREQDRVSVAVPRNDGCGTLEQELRYSGAVPGLAALLVGHGGGGFEDCEPLAGGLTVANVELRLSNDPDDCPDGLVACSLDAEEPSCTDLATSPEHCGACTTRCAENQACRAGACVCSSGLGVLDCAGRCVDSLSSADHCGACGTTCAERCVNGVCDPALGDCISPLELASGGERRVVDFFREGAALEELCGRRAYKRVILAWTPEQTGQAFVEADRSAVAVGFSTDPSCDSWLDCSDLLSGFVLGEDEDRRFRFPVEAGISYRIGLARLFPPGEDKAVMGIEVGFE